MRRARGVGGTSSYELQRCRFLAPDGAGTRARNDTMTSLRVLVADDDKMLSQMLCTILREAGHTASPAFDSVQAMMLAMRQPAPNLVLLDISMPGGSGLDLLTKLKNSTKTKSIPVIVISGNTETQTPDQARTLGAARFVPKPVDPTTLLQVIGEVMEEGRTP